MKSNKILFAGLLSLVFSFGCDSLTRISKPETKMNISLGAIKEIKFESYKAYKTTQKAIHYYSLIRDGRPVDKLTTDELAEFYFSADSNRNEEITEREAGKLLEFQIKRYGEFLYSENPNFLE